MAFAFHTLAYTRRLRDGGIPAQAAEVHADAVREFIMTELVTKSDLEVVRRELETSFSHRFERLETSIATNAQKLEASDTANRRELEGSIGTVRDEVRAFRREIGAATKSLEDRVTVKMGFMLATAIAILAGIIKL